MAVAWDATGAGNVSTGAAISWTHTAGSAGPGTYVLVGVEISVSSNSTATTCTATYGGVSMTLLSGALTLLGSSTNRSAVGIFYLANPASGAQTVTVTPGGASTKARCAANSVSYTAVASIGAQQSAAALALSATSIAGGYDFAVSVNGAAITSPTQTQRYLNTVSVSGVGDSILIQDAAGTGSSISFSSSGTATTPTTLGVALTAVPSITTLTDTFATQDAAKWSFVSGATVSDGQLNVPCITGYAWAQSQVGYDLTGARVYVELVKLPAQSAGDQNDCGMFLSTTPTLGQGLHIWVTNNTLVLREQTGSPDDTTVAYDAVAHKWLGFRESAGTVFWETSPDAIVWTTQRSKAPAASVALRYVFLESGIWGTGGASTAIFDNLNSPGPVGKLFTRFQAVNRAASY